MPPHIPLPNDILMLPAPPNSPALALFSGPIDPATITPTSVIVIDATALAPLLGTTSVFMPASNQLLISPPAAGWPVGHRIAIVLRGGESGLKGANMQPVVGTPAFYFARSAQALSNCTAPAPNCTSATNVLPVDQAIGLEQLRQALAPLFTALEALGIPRTEIALAWTFTIEAPTGDGGVVMDGGASDGGGDASAGDAGAADGGVLDAQAGGG